MWPPFLNSLVSWIKEQRMRMLLQAQYFLWFGSLAGILPYISIFAKNHSSATASEIGFLYTLLPFVAMITKPIFCSIADRFQCHKLVLVSSMAVTLIGYGKLLFTPWFPKASWSWWFICVCVLLANTSMGIVISMNDSIAMREVSNGRASYGSLRVFGTLGWGVLGLLAGVLNESETIKLHLPYLLPGIIMFIVIMSLDIILIIWFYRDSSPPHQIIPHQVPSGEGTYQVERRKRSVAFVAGSSVCKQVTTSFIKHPSLLYYTFVIFVVGFLTAFHWSFFYWFIEDVAGQDTLLMGLCNVVQSFLGEVPFFLVSEWIVKTIGFNNALSISLASIALRYLSYGYFIKKNGYYVLFVELLQGPAYGLFYVVMTAIAQDFSLKSAKSNSPTPFGPTDQRATCHGHNPSCINFTPSPVTANDEPRSTFRPRDEVAPLPCQSTKSWLQPNATVDNPVEDAGQSVKVANVPFVIISEVNGDKKGDDDEVNVTGDAGDASDAVDAATGETLQGTTFETKETSCHPNSITHTGYNIFLDQDIQIDDLDECQMCQKATTNTASPVVTCENDAQDQTYATMQGFFSGLFEGAGLGVGALIAGLTIDKIGLLSAWRFAGYLSLIVCIGNLLVNLNLEKCPGSSYNSQSNSNTR